MNTPAQPTMGEPVSNGSRNAQLDNAKGVLIACVVIGHCVEQLRGGSPALEATFRFIYLFHMPAFAYVSGVLSRTPFDVRQGSRWLATLILPLLVFQALYLAQDAYIQHTPFIYRIVAPYGLLWYLASLACWRVLLIPVLSLRHALTVTCLIAVLAGYVSDISYAFSLSRTLVFLPFFVAGHLFGSITKGPRWLALAGLLLLAALAWIFRTTTPVWLFESLPYPDKFGGVIRAILLALAALGVWSVLRLVPVKRNTLTTIGQRSLAIYLLHFFVINAAKQAGWWIYLRSLAPLWRLAVAFAITAFLLYGLSKVEPLFRPILDFSWIWRNNAKAPASRERN